MIRSQQLRAMLVAADFDFRLNSWIHLPSTSDVELLVLASMAVVSNKIVVLVVLGSGAVEVRVMNVEALDRSIKVVSSVVASVRSLKLHGSGKRNSEHFVPSVAASISSLLESESLARMRLKLIKLSFVGSLHLSRRLFSLGSMLIMMSLGIWDVPEIPRKQEAPVVGDAGHLHSVSVLLDNPVCVAFSGVPLHLEDFSASVIND